MEPAQSLLVFLSSILLLVAFVSETEKEKHQGACQPYYDGLKVPQPQTKARPHHPALSRSVSGPEQRTFILTSSQTIWFGP